MNALKLIVVMAGIVTGIAKAESALYVVEDAKLGIPSAVVLQYGRASYYRNVKFEHVGNGNWRFAGGDRSKLAHIAEVEIVSEATLPPKVTVTLQGYKSLPCVELEEPVVRLQGKTFHVVVAEKEIPPNVRCVTMIDPFELSVELDVAELGRGTYAVNANGTLSHFDILPQY